MGDAQLYRQFALAWLMVLPLVLIVALFWPGAGALGTRRAAR